MKWCNNIENEVHNITKSAFIYWKYILFYNYNMRLDLIIITICLFQLKKKIKETNKNVSNGH